MAHCLLQWLAFIYLMGYLEKIAFSDKVAFRPVIFKLFIYCFVCEQ